MKIKLLGAGDPGVRHPLVTSSFLIQSERSTLVVGIGSGIPAKLESIGIEPQKVDAWIPLDTSIEQIGGLFELKYRFHGTQHCPFLIAPAAVIGRLKQHFEFYFGESGLDGFQLRSVTKVAINEEHYSETLKFIRNYKTPLGYGFILESAEIFVSGDGVFSDEFLERHGMPNRIIMQSCNLRKSALNQNPAIEQLQELPLYLQKKIWLYGYSNDFVDLEDPFPMLFMPQGTSIYESGRKNKWIDKETFIKNDGKRRLGNHKASG